MSVSLSESVCSNSLLVHRPRCTLVPTAHFELGKRAEGVLVGLPLHPPLEHLAGQLEVAEHFLHVSVLVPELVDPRQQGGGPVVQVARVVHELVAHFHFRVLEPQGLVPVVYVHAPLKHRPRARKLLLLLFPRRIPRAER